MVKAFKPYLSTKPPKNTYVQPEIGINHFNFDIPRNAKRVFQRLSRGVAGSEEVYEVPLGKVLYLISANLSATSTSAGDYRTVNVFTARGSSWADLCVVSVHSTQADTNNFNPSVPLVLYEGEIIKIGIPNNDTAGLISIYGWEIDANLI